MFLIPWRYTFLTKAEPGYEGTQWLFVLDIVGSDLSMAKRQMSIIDFRLFTVAMIFGKG